MNEIKNIAWAVSCITICLFFSCLSFTFAEPTLFKAMKELQDSEKAAPDEETVQIQRPHVIYNSSDLRDPFQSPITQEDQQKTHPEASPQTAVQEAEKPLPSFVVQGLVWGGSFPQAIINNKVLKAGDTIEGARIKAIEKGAITFIFEGKEHKLPVDTFKAGIDHKNIP